MLQFRVSMYVYSMDGTQKKFFRFRLDITVELVSQDT